MNKKPDKRHYRDRLTQTRKQRLMPMSLDQNSRYSESHVLAQLLVLHHPISVPQQNHIPRDAPFIYIYIYLSLISPRAFFHFTEEVLFFQGMDLAEVGRMLEGCVRGFLNRWTWVLLRAFEDGTIFSLCIYTITAWWHLQISYRMPSVFRIDHPFHLTCLSQTNRWHILLQPLDWTCIHHEACCSKWPALYIYIRVELALYICAICHLYVWVVPLIFLYIFIFFYFRYSKYFFCSHP